MNKEKFKNNMKTLAKSTYSNRALFDVRNNSFFAPIIIFLLVILMLCVPSYFISKSVKSSTIMKSFPEISEPIKTLFSSNLDCKVSDGILKCSEDAGSINVVTGDSIKYTLIVNSPTISTNIDVVYENPKDTDNIVLLLSQYIKIRYSQRDYVNSKVVTYEIIGNYSKFEGLDFKEIFTKITNDPSLLDTEIESFVYNTYISTLGTKLLVNLASLLISFLVLLLASTLILKMPYLFRRKKGLKFSECLKIAMTSSLPALILGFLCYIFTGIDFATSFGFIYIIRIIFIYFKYIFSTKNNIYKILYKETKEERFNV